MNNCDLDELKHQALQKFIELADGEWTALRCGTAMRFHFGKYTLECDHFDGSIWMYLGGEHIYKKWRPTRRIYKYNTAYEAVPLNKKEQAAADKQYETDLEKYNADPVVVAAKKIYDRWFDAECKAKEEKMKKDMEESCKKLQKEVPALDNERAEVNSLTVDRPWWRRWRS